MFGFLIVVYSIRNILLSQRIFIFVVLTNWSMIWCCKKWTLLMFSNIYIIAIVVKVIVAYTVDTIEMLSVYIYVYGLLYAVSLCYSLKLLLSIFEQCSGQRSH